MEAWVEAVVVCYCRRSDAEVKGSRSCYSNEKVDPFIHLRVTGGNGRRGQVIQAAAHDFRVWHIMNFPPWICRGYLNDEIVLVLKKEAMLFSLLSHKE